MKVLIVNPNTDQAMTENISEMVESFEIENIEVDVIGADRGPSFINSQETISQTYNPVLNIIRENIKKYELFILACHLDPNLEKLREETQATIIGIGQASVLFSKVLGKTFSIIGSSSKTVNLKENMVKSYGAGDYLDLVSYPKGDKLELGLKDRLLGASEEAVRKKDTDAIILGCAGFVDMDKYIEKNLGRDVYDGIIAALIIADGYGKYRKYKEDF